MNHTLKPRKCFRLSKQLLWCFQSSVAVPFLGILKCIIQSMPKDKKKYSKSKFLNELEIRKGLVHNSEQPYRDEAAGPMIRNPLRSLRIIGPTPGEGADF